MMIDNVCVTISEEELRIEKAVHFVKADGHGAMDLFVGTVRDVNVGRKVVSVHYDVFEPLAIHTFNDICELAKEKFTESLKIYISHFKGMLPVGGVSVIIAVSSPHREESFSACRYIIEAIKVRAPIWKQEHYVDGVSEWVQGHALCQHSNHSH